MVTSAKLVILPDVLTLALKVNTAVAPLAILAASPVNTPALSVKVEELIYVNPTGSLSFISTLVAVFGPEFNTVIVYSTSSPIFTSVLLTVFLKLKSAISTTLIVTVDLLLFFFVGSSLLPEISAVLTTVPILFNFT